MNSTYFFQLYECILLCTYLHEIPFCGPQECIEDVTENVCGYKVETLHFDLWISYQTKTGPL